MKNSYIFTRKGKFDVEIENLLHSNLSLESENATARIKNAVDSIILTEGGNASVENNVRTAQVKTNPEYATAEAIRYNRDKSREVVQEVEKDSPKKATSYTPKADTARTEAETAQSMRADKNALLANLLDNFQDNDSNLDKRILYKKI